MLSLQHVGRGTADHPKLDSGSDVSDLLSTSQSESSDEDMASGEEEAGSLESKIADVEMATTSGKVSLLCLSRRKQQLYQAELLKRLL